MFFKNKKIANKLIVLLLLTALVFAVACGDTADKDQGENDPEDKVYSNLLDEESREKVATAMEAAGIAGEDIEDFFKQVDIFNETIENYGLVKEGFKNQVRIEPDYDPFYMQDIHFDNSPIFLGYNCRITSYGLMRNLMTIGNPVVGDTNVIIFDENSIENSPYEIFNEKEVTEFKSLYSVVETQASQDVDVHVASMQKDFQDKEIVFTGDPAKGDASMISLVIHEKEDYDYLFIGHIGVMIPIDGGYYFVEKIAFQEPYQAILFKDKYDVVDYLMEKYDLSWGQETADPFVMENDELMVRPE